MLSDLRAGRHISNHNWERYQNSGNYFSTPKRPRSSLSSINPTKHANLIRFTADASMPLATFFKGEFHLSPGRKVQDSENNENYGKGWDTSKEIRFDPPRTKGAIKLPRRE